MQYNILPLPDSWLSYNISSNKFMDNSLIKNIGYIVEIKHQKSSYVANIYNNQHLGLHFSMVHPSTPFCPSSDITRAAFRSMLFFSSTFKRHCKQYIPGDIQTMSEEQIRTDNILVIDMNTETSACVINVDVMQANGSFNKLHSTIKITKLLDEKYLSNCKEFGKVVDRFSSSGIRKLDGNHGHLHTFGMHRYNGLFKPFSDTLVMNADQLIYKTFVDSVMDMAKNYFPIELSLMIQSEYSRGITSFLNDHPCNNLISKRDGPCSISTSINFATPQHVDVWDGSISIFGWFHIGQPISDGYFLLSNLKVKMDGHDYTGLAIKLVDGLLVTGDGQMICHGTTTSRFNGSIFGIQFAANGISMGSKLETET